MILVLFDSPRDYSRFHTDDAERIGRGEAPEYALRLVVDGGAPHIPAGLREVWSVGVSPDLHILAGQIAEFHDVPHERGLRISREQKDVAQVTEVYRRGRNGTDSRRHQEGAGEAGWEMEIPADP